MDRGYFHQHYKVDKSLPTPIYIQLVRAVVFAIREGRLLDGDTMPSINALSAHYEVTRSTIEKGYSELRDMGILGSHQGKGFYVKQTNIGNSKTGLSQADALTSYQQAIYDACAEKLGSGVDVEMVMVGNDPLHFARIMQERRDEHAALFIVTIPKTANAGH